MPDTKKPEAPKHPVVDEKPASPVPERRQEEVREIALVDVSVPPTAPGAAGAPGASLNDVLRYWGVIQTFLHALMTGVANVKFRVMTPLGKRDVSISITTPPQ